MSISLKHSKRLASKSKASGCVLMSEQHTRASQLRKRWKSVFYWFRGKKVKATQIVLSFNHAGAAVYLACAECSSSDLVLPCSDENIIRVNIMSVKKVHLRRMWYCGHILMSPLHLVPELLKARVEIQVKHSIRRRVWRHLWPPYPKHKHLQISTCTHAYLTSVLGCL